MPNLLSLSGYVTAAERAELGVDGDRIPKPSALMVPLIENFTQPGDLILDINGHPVRTLEEASRLMPVLEGEDDFSLNVERSGKTVPLRFSLAR